MSTRRRWPALLALIVALSLPTSSCQRNEASEMPDDCDQTQQYFDQADSKCRNCSEVMRIFEVGPNQDWQPAGAEAVPLNAPASSEQDLRSRTEIISAVLGSRLTPLPPTGGSPPPVGAPRRPGPLKPSEAILSRLVLGPQSSLPEPPPAPLDAEEDEAAQTDAFGVAGEDGPSAGDLRQADENAFHLRPEQPTKLARNARRWQKLLSGFLQSSEVAESGLLEAIERCRSTQNMSACQMWSNMCVLTMYSHSDSAPPASFAKRPGSSSLLTRGPTTSASGRTREQAPWPRPARFKTRWQQCPKFGLTSVCNSLRDWHRLERQHSLSEMGDIYADEQAEGSRPDSIQSPPLRLNQQIQLLAYEYAFDGRLLRVGQFNLRDLGEFCLFARASGPASSLGLGEGENLLQQEDQPMKSLRDSLDLERHIRAGRSMALRCRFSESQANLLAPTRLNQTKFIDLFVGYQANGAAFVKPVPVLLKNLLYQGQLVNLKHAKDASRWRFVHRFFPLATLKLADGVEGDQDGAVPFGRNSDANQDRELLLFARRATLELKLKRQQDKGLVISSMLLVLDYDQLELSRRRRPNADNSTSSQLEGGEAAEVQAFESHIQLSQILVDMHAYAKELDLFVTVLCIVSSIWGLIKCYNIQKYHGLIKLDIHSLLLFAIVACDLVASLLALVVFAMSHFLFAALKWQLFGPHYLVLAPDESLEQNLLVKLRVALLLKLAGFLYKTSLRLRVDLFFIDWERPKMLTSSQITSRQEQRVQAASGASERSEAKAPHPVASLLQRHQQAQQQISFWRPYTIVNRWLQMQTLRRQNLTVQLVAFLCLVQVANIDRWATTEPALAPELSTANPLEPRLSPNKSATFRALLLALVYLALATLQVLYKRCLHEPMVKCSVREFIDLCSVANVSLFSMLHPRFGFYVHGRNPNGSGDCGIAEVNLLLEREARDLCSKRGLLPNSDQQTFVLVLPKIINDHYRKLLFRADHGPPGATWSAPCAHKSPHQQPAELIKSALSLPGSLAPAAGAPGPASLGSRRALIESSVARNKAVNSFLVNFLEHAYKEIDYSVRARRRLESLLLLELDPNDEDDDPAHRPPKLQGSGGDFAGEAAGESPLAATLFVDTRNSFACLLWLGLEWDLILIELLLLLNLDLWLAQESCVLAVGLVWLINRLFKSVYCILARKNLIAKALLDEKLLIR